MVWKLAGLVAAAGAAAGTAGMGAVDVDSFEGAVGTVVEQGVDGGIAVAEMVAAHDTAVLVAQVQLAGELALGAHSGMESDGLLE